MNECMQILVGRGDVVVTLPAWLPATGWSLNEKGYIRYTSRRVNAPVKRGAYLHRVVFERVSGRVLASATQIHHQNWIKADCCPMNLLACPAAFNPNPTFTRWSSQRQPMQRTRNRTVKRKAA